MPRNPALTRDQTKSFEIPGEENKFEEGEPVWEIAQLFPAQGRWSEEDYLGLDTNHLIEYSHGYLEIIEMPTTSHQIILWLLTRLLTQFIEPNNLGIVLPAPLRIQLWPGKYREPDVIFMQKEHAERVREQYWLGADLVMQVLSPGNRNLDLVTKRREYARAGIPEYWMIDLEEQTVTILTLTKGHYTLHGEFGIGKQATSLLLAGFSVDVTTLFTPKA
ncbi:MAG: Uma2 family endonuclease [Chloroflexi bacterium]|nr:Uma2 family endonuclease [Chloroflexota bacterium]